MIPLTSQVYDATRKQLGDTEVSGGGLFTNTFLLTFLNLSWDRLISQLRQVNSSRLRREQSILLPPYYSSFSPSSFSLTALDTPLSIWVRKIDAQFSILNAVVDSNHRFVTVTTTANHGRTTGDKVSIVEVGGISDDINDKWTITVLTNTAFTLNGCAAEGTYTNGTGKMIYSGEEWGDPIFKADSPSQIPDKVASLPSIWSYMENQIHIQPANQYVEVKIYYSLGDGDIPTGDSISLPIEGCKNFLTFQTAYFAGLGKSDSKKLREYQANADMELLALKRNAVKDQQVNNSRIVSRLPVRRRNTSFPIN